MLSAFVLPFFAHRAERSDVPDAELDAATRARIDSQRRGVSNASFYGAFRRLGEIYGHMDSIAPAAGVTLQKENIGSTDAGNPLYMWTVSRPSPRSKRRFFQVCAVHAREWITPPVCTYLADQLATTHRHLLHLYDVHIMPIANPDGYAYAWDAFRLWRKNRRPCDGGVGVDLNRNWPPAAGDGGDWGLDAGSAASCGWDTYRGPSAASEAEVRAITAYFGDKALDVFLDVHSYGADVIDTSYSDFYEGAKNQTRVDHHRRIGELALRRMNRVADAGYDYRSASTGNALYPVSGDTTNYFRTVKGAHTCVVEMRPAQASAADGFAPDASAIAPAVREGWRLSATLMVETMVETMDCHALRVAYRAYECCDESPLPAECQSIAQLRGQRACCA